MSVDVTVEEEVGVLCFEDGERGHKPRTAGRPQKLEKARRQIPPWSSRRNRALDFSPKRLM